jgi:hypothetical protein
MWQGYIKSSELSELVNKRSPSFEIEKWAWCLIEWIIDWI